MGCNVLNSVQVPRILTSDANSWATKMPGRGEQSCGTSEPIVRVVSGNLCARTVDLQKVGDIEATQDEGQDLEEAKRIVLLLNATLGDERLRALAHANLTVKRYSNFGRITTPLNELRTAKQLIRQGRVIWVHAEVRPIHYTRPTWFTQTCRSAHRAAAQWTMRFTTKPWAVRPFEALRRRNT